VVKALSGLSDEELTVIADKPELLKEFAAKRVADNIANIFVVHMDDKDVPDLHRETVTNWRKYASDLGYTGPVAWRVKVGFTLKSHAPLAGPCYNKLGYLQNWELKNDEPTKDSLVFWVPRLARDSVSTTIPQMEKIRKDLRKHYKMPAHHSTTFGSIALLFALILAHFKRTGERVPLQYQYAASDTFHVGGDRLLAGVFSEGGLYCLDWSEGAYGNVGFFLLGVEELGQ
jgi:hypothetical protein